MRLSPEARPGALAARIYTVEPTGDITFVHVRLGEHILVASTAPGFHANADDPIWLDFNQDHLHLFDAATGAALSEATAPSGMAAGREPVQQAR